MIRPLPPSVRRTQDGPDVCYRLPRGLMFYGGLFTLAWAVWAAVSEFGINVFAFAQVKVPGIDPGLPATVFGIFIAAVGLAGLAMVAYRDEVRVGRGVLSWRPGPVRYRTQTVLCERVRRFVVGRANEETGGNDTRLGGKWSVLFVEDVDGRRRQVGFWHRREMLLPLADELAAACRADDDPADGPAVGVIDDPDNRFFPDQPEDSRLVLTRTPAGVVIAVPPLGRRCLDRYFYGCSILFPVVLAPWILIGVGTLAGVVPWDPAPPPRWVLVGVFVVGFGSLIALLLASGVCQLATAYGRSELRVEAGTLVLEEWDFIGTRRREWRAEDVKDVWADVVPRTNTKDVVVLSRSGGRDRLLGHCPAADVKWVAAVVGDELAGRAAPR